MPNNNNFVVLILVVIVAMLLVKPSNPQQGCTNVCAFGQAQHPAPDCGCYWTFAPTTTLPGTPTTTLPYSATTTTTLFADCSAECAYPGYDDGTLKYPSYMLPPICEAYSIGICNAAGLPFAGYAMTTNCCCYDCIDVTTTTTVPSSEYWYATQCEAWMTSLGKDGFTTGVPNLDACYDIGWNACQLAGTWLDAYDLQSGCCVWKCA